MGRLDNNAYKNDGARIQEFKKWQQIPDTTIESLEDFMYWYENDYDFGDMEVDEYDMEIKIMRKLIDTFLLQAGTQPEAHEISLCLRGNESWQKFLSQVKQAQSRDL